MIIKKTLTQEEVKCLYLKDSNLKSVSVNKNGESVLKYYAESKESRSIIKNIKNILNQDSQISKKHQSMIVDIYAEMKNIFGTSSDESAQRMVAMYEAMVKRPKNYIDTELGFIDENSIVTYASEKLLLADKYALFVLKRIAKFEKEKISILEN